MGEPPTAGGGSTEPGLRAREAWILLVVLIAVFDVVKVGLIEYSTSDENLYYYMGKLLAEGHLPYRDFRFAHPPVRLLPPALIFATLGFSFTALKLLPLLAANVTAVFLFRILRRAHSPLLGLVGAATFLLSFPGLFYTSYYMGTNLTVALLVVGLYLLETRRDRAAGALFAVAMLTGLYAACAAVAVGVHLLATERERLKPLAVGLLAVFVPANLLLVAVGGSGYLEHVYRYHFLKPADAPEGKAFILLAVARRNAPLLAGALLYPFFRSRTTDRLYLVGVAFLALLAFFISVHDYYFNLAAAFLCAPAAAALLGTLRLLFPEPPALALTAGLALAVFGAANLGHARDLAGGGAIPDAPEVASMVREMTPEGEAVFGVLDVAPLVAMLADRDIVDLHADTNAKVYMAGTADLEGVKERLAEPRAFVVIGRERHVEGEVFTFFGPLVDPGFRRFLMEHYEVFYSMVNARDPEERYVFFGRRRETPEGPRPPR